MTHWHLNVTLIIPSVLSFRKEAWPLRHLSCQMAPRFGEKDPVKSRLANVIPAYSVPLANLSVLQS